jgi:hypothetical protein
MSTVEIIVQLLPTLTAVELCAVMKSAAELISKSSKPKAARGTKPVPTQLAENNTWVKAVFEYSKENGWESFEAKDGEKLIKMEASVDTPEGPRYEDGSEITMRHAMSLAKKLKDSGSDLWTTFSEAYDAEHPKEEKESAAAEPVRKTRAEISAAAAKKKRLAEEEKAAKAAVREAEKKEREAAKLKEAEAKEAAKKKKAEDIETAKRAKEAEKSAKLPSASSETAARMAALLAKVKSVKGVEEAEKVIAAVAPAAAAAAPAKKSLSQLWKAPPKGEWKVFPHKGTNYVANHLYHVYSKTAVKGEAGEWVGQYIVAEDRIDDEADEPMHEAKSDDEEDEDS